MWFTLYHTFRKSGRIYYMNIRENVPISGLVTMRLGGSAKYVAEVTELDDIVKAIRFAKERDLPFWVMGSGANTIGRDAGFDGVVILNQIRGIFVKVGEDYIAQEDLTLEQKIELGDEIALVGMGGEVWDDFVKVACELGYTGIEAMSMISGTVGAAPVQNIGAYGQEIAKVIESVEAFDLREEKFVTLDRSEMRMGYRCTRFNCGEDAGRFLITSITVRLKRGEMEPPFYNSLQRYIDEHGETDFSPTNIRRMVSEIRSDKLPDPKYVASAGSFFKNVYVDKKGADEAEKKGIPVWRDTEGKGKINSGWLIEQCGLKGEEFYGFKVSDKAALVLINKNAKSYADLAKARAKIVDAVKEKFGYILEQEPVEIPSKEDGR